MVRWGARIVWLIVALLVLIALAAALALQAAKRAPADVDFTRHLSAHAPGDTDTSATFVAEAGAARLLITCSGTVAPIALTLNDEPVLDAVNPVSCAQAFEQDIQLAANNRLQISWIQPSLAFTGDAAAADSGIPSANVRIKQTASVDLNVLSRVHFNANVSDFEASRKFYGSLGFATISGFPDTNTQAMARAIGIETPTAYDGSQGDHAGSYLLHGELIGLGLLGGVIDLIEFTIPRDETPPYERLNRLGMAYSVMFSADIEGDVARMLALGVRFLAPVTERANGERFTVFTDPDGIFYELRQTPAATPASDQVMQITTLGPLGVNVSDFERSRAWYQMFGYELTAERTADESSAVGQALGLDGVVRRRTALLTHNVDGSTMELNQWLQPYDPRPPYPIPVNHLGIHRTALATSDIAADVAILKAQGVEFVSPITPCCSGPDSSGSIVAFYDPDGTIVELVEQPAMTWLTPLMLRLRNLF